MQYFHNVSTSDIGGSEGKRLKQWKLFHSVSKARLGNMDDFGPKVLVHLLMSKILVVLSAATLLQAPYFLDALSRVFFHMTPRVSMVTSFWLHSCVTGWPLELLLGVLLCFASWLELRVGVGWGWGCSYFGVCVGGHHPFIDWNNGSGDNGSGKGRIPLSNVPLLRFPPSKNRQHPRKIIRRNKTLFCYAIGNLISINYNIT